MPRIAMIMGNYPEPEYSRRRDKILSYSGGDLEMGVIRVPPSPYQAGFGGDGASTLVPVFVEAFRQAEAEGYEAVIPLGVLDIGVEAGRHAVNIPVIGTLESVLHVASFLGRRIGLISYSENLLPVLSGLVGKYGFTTQVVGYAHVGTELTGLASASDRLQNLFIAEARALERTHQVDVIVSAGISLCPLHIDRLELERQLGLPVVEAIGAPIQMAAAVTRLNARHSRKTWPASAG
jgi:allantoin racemase